MSSRRSSSSLPSAAAAWLLCGALLGAGCATAPAGGPAGAAPAPVAAATPGDPWEAWNRRVFAFNDVIDNAVLKPVATAYRNVVPQLVRTGIGNVLGNIRDVWSTANHFLQGKPQTGLEMGLRVVTNTVFGIGGVLDPATEMRLPRRSEDLGQTLGRWGVGTGPYLVLPLLGPSSVRDTAGFLVDYQFSPSQLPNGWAGQTAVTTVSVIDTRAGLLDTTKLLDEVALDRYSFVRDAYRQARLDAVYDGAPPMETFDDQPADRAARPAASPAQAASAARSVPAAPALLAPAASQPAR